MKRITLPAFCGLILFFSGCSKKNDPDSADLRNEYVGTWIGKIIISGVSTLGRQYDNTVVISKMPGSKDKITAVDPSGNSTSFTATVSVSSITVDSFRYTETIDGVKTTLTSNYAVGPIMDGKSLMLNGMIYSSKGTSYDGSWYGHWIK